VQAEKRKIANVTEDGLRFATLSAARTAASILTKTVEHHVQEAQQELDIAEASEYRDVIKADIKAWAFQVRLVLLAEPPVSHAFVRACVCVSERARVCLGVSQHAWLRAWVGVSQRADASTASPGLHWSCQFLRVSVCGAGMQHLCSCRSQSGCQQGGTRRGLRNLLTSLDKVLWEGAVWQCKSLADVSTDAQLKKWLNKARLLLHTDKMARQPEKIRLRAELILIEIDKALKGVT
jgi:hypothetical protein